MNKKNIILFHQIKETITKDVLVSCSYIFFTYLLLFDLCLQLFRLSFAGYFTDIVFFWLWAIETIYILIRYSKKIWIKIYTWFLFSGVILSIIPMALPFFAIITSTTGLGLVYSEQLNNKYRFQIAGYSLLIKPRIELIENKGIFEKDILRTDVMPQINDSISIDRNEFEKVSFISENDSIITLEIFGKGHRVIENFKKNDF